VLAYAVTVWLLLTLNFLLPRALPGDPIAGMLSTSSSTVRDPATRAVLSRYYGLDRPLLNQYGDYLARLARGDLGVSIRQRVPVVELVAERLPWTLLLTATAAVLGIGVGVLAGVQSGWRRGGRVDKTLTVVFSAVAAFPAFFLASAILLLFAVTLRWVPLGGATTAFVVHSNPFEQVGDVLHHLVLPASVLAVQFAATNFLLMRGGMAAQLGADHLMGGRAKGLRERRLKYRYAARNALLPVVTQAALQLAVSVAVAVVFVESAFAYPGIGGLLFDAVRDRDYPVLQGCFLVLTVLTVTLNLGADLLNARLDPRTVA